MVWCLLFAKILEPGNKEKKKEAYFMMHRINRNDLQGKVTWILIMLFSLVWFYGISTIVGYLMPNPFLYI